jgi:Flp pilus assembly protein TadB
VTRSSGSSGGASALSDQRDQDQPRGYRGTTGRVSGTYQNRPDDDRVQRSRQARQILSGAEIRPPNRSLGSYPAPTTVLTQPQMLYGAALGILLVLGLLLWLVFGMGVASIIFFLLALGLLGGWLAF